MLQALQRCSAYGFSKRCIFLLLSFPLYYSWSHSLTMEAGKISVPEGLNNPGEQYFQSRGTMDNNLILKLFRMIQYIPSLRKNLSFPAVIFLGSSISLHSYYYFDVKHQSPAFSSSCATENQDHHTSRKSLDLFCSGQISCLE